MTRILSVKNFAQYQHDTHRDAPWIKLRHSLYTDKEFIRLPVESRYLYVGLLTLCSECSNRLEEDHAYIAHRLALPEHKIPTLLEPLLLRTEDGCERGLLVVDGAGAPQRPDPPPPSRRAAKPALSDEEFLAQLKANPAYAHIDFEVELGKIDAWLLAHPGRKKTRRFLVNCLNRVERPLDAKSPTGRCMWSVRDGGRKRQCGAAPAPGQPRPFCVEHLKDREALDRRIEESKRAARATGA